MCKRKTYVTGVHYFGTQQVTPKSTLISISATSNRIRYPVTYKEVPSYQVFPNSEYSIT
jgi:hypothetical protein